MYYNMNRHENNGIKSNPHPDTNIEQILKITLVQVFAPTYLQGVQNVMIQTEVGDFLSNRPCVFKELLII